jgi:hypothetical protein
LFPYQLVRQISASAPFLNNISEGICNSVIFVNLRE